MRRLIPEPPPETLPETPPGAAPRGGAATAAATAAAWLAGKRAVAAKRTDEASVRVGPHRGCRSLREHKPSPAAVLVSQKPATGELYPVSMTNRDSSAKQIYGLPRAIHFQE